MISDMIFSLAENEDEVELAIKHARSSSALTFDKIKKAFDSSEFKSYLLDEDAVRALSDELNAKLLDESSDEDIELSKIVAHAVDAQLSINISDDAMSAELSLSCAQGGKHLKAKEVLNFLSENEIKKGLSGAAIKLIIRQAKESESGEILSVKVAQGALAIKGDDGFIDYLTDDPMARILAPKKLADGKVDMRDLGDILFVKKGTKLAQLIAPTDGVPGYTVTGTVLESEAGEPEIIELGEGVSFFDEENTVIISDLDGMPKRIPTGVSVFEVFSVDTVDVGIGNVNFDGTLIVQGDIAEAMTVNVTGDVIVGGTIEYAKVRAGGDIIVEQGIIGHQVEGEFDGFSNSCMLVSGGFIKAKYIQYANLRAKGDITVEAYLSHSQVTLIGALWVGKESAADGKLFSCYIQGGKSIHAGIIGSLSSAATTLDFNHLLDAYAELKNKLNDKSEHLIERTRQISKLISQIENKQLEREDLLSRLNDALKKQLPLISKINKSYYQTTDKMTEHIKVIEVVATHSILSGAEISIADGICSFKREYGPTKVYYDNRIVVEPITSATEENKENESE